MPQLDLGTFLYQVLPVLLTFWSLIYIFLVSLLPQGSWLLKMRTKLSVFRNLINRALVRQAYRVGSEYQGLASVILIQGLGQPSAALTAAVPATQPAVMTSMVEVLMLSEDQAAAAEMINQSYYKY